jgi:hypothetical protein
LVSGDSVSGDAVSGDSVSGDAVSGDSVSGDAVSGDAVSGDAGELPGSRHSNSRIRILRCFHAGLHSDKPKRSMNLSRATKPDCS